MNINWDKITQIKYAWAFVGLLFIISLISNTGIRYLIKVKWEIRSIKKEIAEIEKQNKELEQKAQLTRNNPKLMEIYARTKLGMVKPDETVYEIK
jgi:cell division protein FtsB